MVNVKLGSKNHIQIPISKVNNMLKILLEPKKDEIKGNIKKIESVAEMLREMVEIYTNLLSKKENKPSQMSGYNKFIEQLQVPEGENTMKYGARIWSTMSEEEKQNYK